MVLIIIAREKEAEKSHNRYILEKAKEEFDKKGVSYDVLDLYEENFDPVLRTTQERDIEKYEDLIEKNDKFMFIYPIWWNAPPAILKGFLEIVFHAGFAFHYENTLLPGVGRPVGHFQGKKAVTITTSGSPNWLFLLYQRRMGIKVVKNDVLKMCGMTAKSYHVGGAQKFTQENRKRIEKKVYAATKWLE